jgi:hypothetical protein
MVVLVCVACSYAVLWWPISRENKIAYDEESIRIEQSTITAWVAIITDSIVSNVMWQVGDGWYRTGEWVDYANGTVLDYGGYQGWWSNKHTPVPGTKSELIYKALRMRIIAVPAGLATCKGRNHDR